MILGVLQGTKTSKHQNTKTALVTIGGINIGKYPVAFRLDASKIIKYCYPQISHTRQEIAWLVWSKRLKPKLIYEIQPY